MIEFLFRSEVRPVRYTLPAANKIGLKKDLESLGVSHDTLYQSLESTGENYQRNSVCLDGCSEEINAKTKLDGSRDKTPDGLREGAGATSPGHARCETRSRR